MNSHEILDLGKEAILAEIEGLQGVMGQLDGSFARAVEVMAGLKGKVILTGVGKSGIIARKIASTMVSIGTPAMFMHPVDGLHGDLGTIMPHDAVIVLSNSGNTREILDLIPPLKALNVPIIAITGKASSQLALKADITLSCSVEREACSLNLAPTASTTAQLALGDALAVVLSHIKGFDRDSFKMIHPAGELGRQLMSKIEDVMITGERIPLVEPGTPLPGVVVEMTDKSLGFTLVGSVFKIEGIVTDGDLRRVLLKWGHELHYLTARDIMAKNPKRIFSDKLAIDALDMMERFQITSLIVTDEAEEIKGVVHLHDLLGRGRLGLRGV